MEFHLMWIIPMSIFIWKFIREPRKVSVAYWFVLSFFLFAFLMGIQLFSTMGEWNIQLTYIIVFSILFGVMIMIVLSPLYLLFNGRQMMRFEGMRLVNLLSLLYGVSILFLWGMSYVGLGYVFAPFSFVLMYFSLLYFSYVTYSIGYNLYPFKSEPHYILVLGSGLIGDQVPPLLAQRLDRGIHLYKKYNEHPLFIVSGGKGDDEVVSEASAMKKYLVSKGIKEDLILVEDQSTTTFENLTFSKKILQERGDEQKTVAVVTNSFHVFRAVIYMRLVGLNGYGSGSKTAFYFLPSAYIRETVALMKMYWKWHACVMIIQVGAWAVPIINDWLVQLKK